MVKLGPIPRERASDSIYEALRLAILDHVFLPQERLDVRVLARRFGVSPTPVKNAIQMLATLGLVEVRPRSGTFVALLSAKDVAETFHIRRALECLAAESAVRNVGDEVLEQLRKLIGNMRRPCSAEQHAKQNTEFHRIIVRLSGNRRLLEMYDDLNAHIRIARVHSAQSDWKCRIDAEHEEHQGIVAALALKEPALLAEALRKHIERGREALVAALKVKEP